MAHLLIDTNNNLFHSIEPRPTPILFFKLLQMCLTLLFIFTILIKEIEYA